MMAQLLEIQPVVESLIKQVDTLVGTLNETVKRIDPILAQVEAQLGTTQQALNELTQLLGDTHALFAQLNEDQAVLVDGASTTLNRLNEELLPGMTQMFEESRGMIVGTFGELNQTLDLVQAQLPDLLATMQETLENTREITESTKQTWPFNRSWKKKAKAEAAAAKKKPAGP